MGNKKRGFPKAVRQDLQGNPDIFYEILSTEKIDGPIRIEDD